jgi:predicted RNA-binding protein with TRAM domain
MALNVERRIRNLARRSQAPAWLFEVSSGVAERFAGDRLKRLEKQVGRRIFLEGGSSLPVDTFRVLAEGTAQHVQAQRVPVREGQEVDVALEFSLSYSPRDAVGYVDGYMVVVEGGRQFLGETKKVRITATARTGGQGTLVKTG